ncbi:hypothetical protein [Actinoplanes utahensis]|uniref:Uncharacterized protein n=1 Tax=Actinoplanes utahensis TaxID=1869 RepID=A0A0A6UDI1_ACTUT|nr:hypothetical protein [Actinoplanes utahensis]KHD73551.1 hypothetical protein MB27_34035 [Actinoplanes utahensis]GIF33893.1 hypothetical protein Aut01nite_68790 [Actinoplanes utahensis]
MTDHWDHDDDFDLDAPEDLPPPAADDPHPLHDDTDVGFDDDTPVWQDEPTDVPDLPDTVDAVADDTVFPPALAVDLPEPVDGFPWIDTATLGAGEAFTPPTDPVTAEELAAYAGVDIPAGADAWTVLADSDDPATAALARWWTPGEQ